MRPKRLKSGLKRKYMASFQVTGFINTIKYLPDSLLVYVDEYKRGYKKQDGTIVDDKYLSWKCIFKQGFAKYISKHFGDGMLVEVKGEIMPYAIEKEKLIDGYSVIAQTINVASYPKSATKREIKMIKDSQSNMGEKPDLDSFITPDF